MNSTRQPLPAGTIIEFCGDEAEVVSDDGGSRLTVAIDGYKMAWWWIFEGVSCSIVTRPESAPN